MSDPYKRASKFISLLLRHDPAAGGLTLDQAGWADVDALLCALNAKGHRLDRSRLDDLVASNSKARYAFDETGTRIRAVQGHSIDVALGYDPVVPPDRLYHGTVARFIPSIREHGLLAGSRTHVHLSPDVETAITVGRRRGTPVVLTIDAAAMHAEDIECYVADNGVWLTHAVAARFIIDWGGADNALHQDVTSHRRHV